MVGLLCGLMAYGDRPAAAEAELTSEDWNALEIPSPLETPPFAVGVPPELPPPEPGESDGPVITDAVGVIDAEFVASAASSAKEIKRRKDCNYYYWVSTSMTSSAQVKNGACSRVRKGIDIWCSKYGRRYVFSEQRTTFV